jgi:hypothetical protein
LDGPVSLNEVFRSQRLSFFRIMSKSDLEKKLNFKFTSELDPVTGKNIEMSFNAKNFVKVENLGLF